MLNTRHTRDPKKIGDVLESSLELLVNRAKTVNGARACSYCGTPYRLHASRTRNNREVTWTARLEADCTILALPHTHILELRTVTVRTLDGERLLDLEREAHAQDTCILTNADDLQPGDTATVTAHVSVPNVVLPFPQDRCCPARARDLGERMKGTSGKTQEAQSARNYGTGLVAWAEKREAELIAQAEAQPALLETDPSFVASAERARR
jgi:hypothetical protein